MTFIKDNFIYIIIVLISSIILFLVLFILAVTGTIGKCSETFKNDSELNLCIVSHNIGNFRNESENFKTNATKINSENNIPHIFYNDYYSEGEDISGWESKSVDKKEDRMEKITTSRTIKFGDVILKDYPECDWILHLDGGQVGILKNVDENKIKNLINENPTTQAFFRTHPYRQNLSEEIEEVINRKNMGDEDSLKTWKNKLGKNYDNVPLSENNFFLRKNRNDVPFDKIVKLMKENNLLRDQIVMNYALNEEISNGLINIGKINTIVNTEE